MMALFGLCECSWLQILLILVAVYLIYWIYHAQYFKRQGIDGPTPFPLFGTFLPAFTQGQIAHMVNLNKQYGSTYGAFLGSRPTLCTMDLDIIKEVFVKEHRAFPNRFTLPTGKMNQYMLNNISDYDDWKRMRSLMSPAFSTGKLKRMMNQINRCARQCVDHMTNHCSDHSSMEAKEFAGSYTMDVIASTAFGIDVNTKEDHNNEFVRMARRAFTFKRFNPVILVGFFFPALTPLLKWSGMNLFDKEVTDFFGAVTEQTLKDRQDAQDGERVDFLTLMKRAHQDDHSADKEELIEAEGNIVLEKQQKGMSHEEVVAQGLLFFLAGYETTAAAISFLAYSLATNPAVQDKLRAEVTGVMQDKDSDVDVTHDDLQEMPYLEQCIHETLRLYPSLVRLDRAAACDTVVHGIQIPKNGLVSVPIWLLHRNPQYYPEPEAFKPERFSPEEKAKRPSYCFMPFGAGPRNCLAMRLALLEVKMAMVHMLRQHHFVSTPETEVPLELSKFGLLKAKNGINIRLEACC